jgi:hypothetical protein
MRSGEANKGNFCAIVRGRNRVQGVKFDSTIAIDTHKLCSMGKKAIALTKPTACNQGLRKLSPGESMVKNWY